MSNDILQTKETDLWRCTVCGRFGTVGRCCGEETRERVTMEQLLAENEALLDALRERLRREAEAEARLTVAQQPAEQHPDDAAVDRFAAAMKAKLKKKRQEGRAGWQFMSSKQLSALLHEHVRKGDPVDVANLAMMLHQNGQVIEPPAAVVTDEMVEILQAEVERLREALKDMRQSLEVLSRAHQTAMEQAMKARIPECAEFARIAQDLDFVVAALRERLGEGKE